MAENLLSSNFDIIFMILLLLPAETLLQVQTVCRTWAQVISDPAFVRAHCSRPALITAIFTSTGQIIGNQRQTLKPFRYGAKFPTSISDLLSNGFKVASRNGMLCFHRDEVFVVGNPATSYCSVVLNEPTPGIFRSRPSYVYRGVALIYDPAISLSFQLAVVLVKFDCDELIHYIKFNIYSSETCLWTKSSKFTKQWNPHMGLFDRLEPCKLGGGPVFWSSAFGFFIGYEIATDTFWKTPLPLSSHDAQSEHMSGYDGIIHFTRIGSEVTKVWRLETKDSWILEGEGSSGELRRVVPHSTVYDTARGALLIGNQTNGEIYALHCSSSRFEILYQGLLQLPMCLFDSAQVAHCNTLAPMDGVERGMDGLAREFRWMGLSLLNM